MAMVLLATPIWLPFYLLPEWVAEPLIIKAAREGYILDSTSQALLLSFLYLILSPSLLGTFSWCASIYRRTKFLPLSSHIANILRFRLMFWLASLIFLPIIAFQITGSEGIVASYKMKTPGFEVNYEQNVVDQIELLRIENQYSLNLSPSDRRKMLDIAPSSSIDDRSIIIVFYDEFKRLQDKYHADFKRDEKLEIAKLAEKTVYVKNDGWERPSKAEILKFLEYSFISKISEDRALKKITSFTSDELKLFGKFQPNKFWLPRFSRHRSIELTKLYKHDLSNEQRKVFYEDYCNVVVNSIYRAYHVESGDLPGKNDSRMIKSEAKNPQGNPDFNDCRKFLLDKGYQLSDGAMFTYFYKP
ncbi:hypothetical protein [Microcystis aeruginosa]|nr:hypothetical protein [Microcystis aeruginosa]